MLNYLYPVGEKQLLWPCPGRIPPLPCEQVHVYAWDLDASPLAEHWESLDEKETLRARRFVFPRDRDRFVRAHATMRRILGEYSGISPERICFVNGAHGKPRIDSAPGAEPLQFNLSHSGEIAVLSIARTYDLGIDVEVVRPIERDIAEHHFSPAELLALGSVDDEEWLSGFYLCWTSKEALLKGEGLGLNLPLNAFDVEAHPERAPALLACRPPTTFAPGWQLFPLRPTRNAVGTLAVRDAMGTIPVDVIQYFSINA